MIGFINILKPAGISSAYAVGAVKKKFNAPCGHMGTLDPMASGVLPVGVGQASRLFPYMIEKEKRYIAEFKFGVLTDTLDTTGKIEKADFFVPSEAEIKSALSSFIGNISQVPPKYSAKCVDGKRGYALARRGVEFTLDPKKVNINSFELIEKTGVDTYSFEISCSGGTYVRSLARDLGIKTNSLAVMSRLERIKSGIFTLQSGIKLEDFKTMSIDEIKPYVIRPDAVVVYDKIVLSEQTARKILDGVFDNLGYPDGLYRVYNGTEFRGIGESIDGILKIKSYVRDL